MGAPPCSPGARQPPAAPRRHSPCQEPGQHRSTGHRLKAGTVTVPASANNKRLKVCASQCSDGLLPLMARRLASSSSTRGVWAGLDRRGDPPAPLDLVPHLPHGDAGTPRRRRPGRPVGRGAPRRPSGAVAHERDGGQILDTAGVQAPDRRTDLLERDPGVQKALDDLEDQDVAEGIEPLNPLALNRWLKRLACASSRAMIRDAGGSVPPAHGSPSRHQSW